MSLFDGTSEALTYGQALENLVYVASWPSEAHRDEMLDAVRGEHGIVVPKATPTYADPRDEALVGAEAELAEARAQLAEVRRENKAREDAAELVRLRSQVAQEQGGQ